jgi:hypothetical protein
MQLRSEWSKNSLFVTRKNPNPIQIQSTDGPLILRPKPVRLEVRRNFFSNRVVDSWNQIPSDMKNTKNVGIFKRLYRTHREAQAIGSSSSRKKVSKTLLDQVW